MRWACACIALWSAPTGWAFAAQVRADAPEPPARVMRVELALDDASLESRLGELSPDDPEAYFLLGEEVADEPNSPERLALARRLFVLALHLDLGRSAPTVAAPACRALASLAASDGDQQWLEAVAWRLDQSGPPAGASAAASTPSMDVAHRAATAFGLARSGRAHLAERYLEDPAVAALIQRYDDLLRVDGLPGATNWLEEQIETWPLSAGSLERVEKVRGTTPPRYRLDTTNKGNPGPALTDRELVAFLRLESRLLSGIHRSWAAQIAADLGAPLRDADPASVPQVLGVDPSRSIYRAGVWISPAEIEPATGASLDSPLTQEQDPAEPETDPDE